MAEMRSDPIFWSARPQKIYQQVQIIADNG